MEIEENTPDIHDPITFIVTPERIGRDNAPEPFKVSIGSHVSPTADMLADRIIAHAKDKLLSQSFMVRVDMKRQTFSISHGRFGKGTFAEVAS